MDIREHQPHIVVILPDSVHVIAIPDLRILSNDGIYNGDKDELIKVLSKALLDNL